MVVPDQQWLVVIFGPNGRVIQFVAARVASGYSIVAQINGSDRLAGILSGTISSSDAVNIPNESYRGNS